MGNRSLDDFLGGDESAHSDEARPENEPSDGESDGDTDPGPSDREQSVETDDGAVTDDGDRSAESDDADAVGDDGDSPYVDPEGVKPAETTYAWGGDGGVCDACGERSERRWRQDDGLVCPDCKEWSAAHE